MVISWNLPQKNRKNFYFHDLWHTFASWLIMNGIDLKTVQELLGHHTYQMTLKYSHLSPEHRQYAVDILTRRTRNLGLKSIEHGINLAQAKISGFAENAETIVIQ